MQVAFCHIIYFSPDNPRINIFPVIHVLFRRNMRCSELNHGSRAGSKEPIVSFEYGEN